MSDKDLLKKLADIEKTLAKISKSSSNHSQTLYNNNQRLIHLEKIINFQGDRIFNAHAKATKRK